VVVEKSGWGARRSSIFHTSSGSPAPERNVGLDIELALRRARDDVLKATRNKQEPFKYGSLGGAEIALVPTKETQQAATPPKLAIDYDKEMEITFWNAVKDSKSKDLLQAYLDRYPSGNFAGQAKNLTDQLAEAARRGIKLRIRAASMC